jgi:protein-S-isoprenylcysteine O-methyltransferase Ste14
MSINQVLLASVYTAIVCSLIWARFRFFKINNKKSKMVSYFNDPAVFVQLIFTYGLLWSADSLTFIETTIAVTIYSFSLSLFWWAIRSAGELDFASSGSKGKIVTTGAFGFVRHPFYLSYIAIWLTSTILFNSIFLWISLFALLTVYVISARAEEASILIGNQEDMYKKYISNVNMFFPKVSFSKTRK